MVPRDKPPLFLDFSETTIPEHSGVPRPQEEPFLLSVAVDYDTGTPRPQDHAVRQLAQSVAQLKTRTIKVFVPRGEYPNVPWRLVSLVDGRVTDVSRGDRPFNDYEIYGWGKRGRSTVVKVYLYPDTARLPNAGQLHVIVSTLPVEDDVVVLFYLPPMHPDSPEWAFCRKGRPASDFRIYEHRTPERLRQGH